MESTDNQLKDKSARPLPVVAIGASAGGIQAVSELLRSLSSETGFAYIYIQHLDPNYDSKLTEILQRETEMKVLEVTDHLKLTPNQVYVIPPNKEMDMIDGTIKLKPRQAGPSVPMPIDHFFLSLAEKYQDASIGIVLSGSASDGTVGLKAIKTAGGITIAQDESAQFQGMPRSAISEGVVDMVLRPSAIAKELERLSRKAEIMNQIFYTDNSKISDDDKDLNAILQILKKSTGVDFFHYKMKTIKRRIVRRLLLHRLDSLVEYLAYVKNQPDEIHNLYQDLLINVTSFFRDSDTLEYLKKTVIPKLLKSKPPNDPIRIWVPACSTGEEAYSLAMIFVEVLSDSAENHAIQLFATDLSEVTIAKARLGVYSKNEVTNVSPERLKRFFTKIDGSYRIEKQIRDLCVFAPHNMLKDPPFSKIDLISCCNLMIYLDDFLQKKILTTFYYALNPEGLLILGKSETVGPSTQLFSVIEKRFKVFSRKRETSQRNVAELNYRLPDSEKSHTPVSYRAHIKAHDDSTELEDMVDRVLLEKYIPASVVVNQNLEILQFRGPIGLYLEPTSGKASLNLLKMARPGLSFELRNTIHKASKTGQQTKKTGIEIYINNASSLVSIEAVPLRTEMDEKLFLVLFTQVVIPETSAGHSTKSKDKLVKQLEDELRAVKEDMRSIIEEQEAGNEELQSANEEIVSSNEELQSINEELETSKEELESANEELMTINTELQMRNEQLAEAFEYAEAVFDTVREGILILNKDLRIKSANKSFYNIFKTREDEIEGLLIFELAERSWDIPQLRNLLINILSTNQKHQELEIRHNFPNVGEKTILVNACKVVQKVNQQQLILLAFEDITEWMNKHEK